MVLNDATIENMLYQLFDFNKSSTTVSSVKEQINPNSVDLTLDRDVMRINGHYTVMYGEDNSNCWKYKYETEDNLLIKPNECILCCTREYIVMPQNLCGQVFTKSTFGRMFVNHMMAGVVDAGFEGRLTLEFKNDSQNDIIIPFGSRVVQLVYMQLCEKAKEPYNMRKNRYNKAEQCEAAKSDAIYG